METDAFRNNNPHLLQEIILQYVHAEQCQRLENPGNGAKWPCSVPDCENKKSMLRHMWTCRLGDNECETLRHCRTLKKCLLHWENCSTSDCPLFSEMRLVEEEWRAQQVVASNVESAAVEAAAEQSPYSVPDKAIIEQDIVGMIEADQLSDLVHDEISPTPAQVVKEWHQSVSPEIRKRMMDKIMQPLVTTCHLHTITEKELTPFVKRHEHALYEVMNSREEYYKEVAASIHDFHKTLELLWRRDKLQDLYHQQRRMLMRRLNRTRF